MSVTYSRSTHVQYIVNISWAEKRRKSKKEGGVTTHDIEYEYDFISYLKGFH
jgi:hypothetical protein